MKPKNRFLDICQFSGSGHYKIGKIINGKMYKTTTSDMPSIDNYKSDDCEKDGRRNRNKQGFDTLYNQIKRANNIYEYKQ